MHLNYHFLKYLCPELEKAFSGKKISACFSQNKDELIIETEDENESRYIRAHFLPPQIYLSFPENFQRAKRNSIDLFKELVGETIVGCQVLNFERAFYLKLSSGKILLFKLHANRSNVLLYEEGGTAPVKMFRNGIAEDRDLDWNSLNKSYDLSYESFESQEGNASKFLPTLGAIPRNWLKERGYPDAEISAKWELMQELLDMLDTPLFSLVEKNGEIHLSLLPEENPVKRFSNPIQAINELFYLALVRGNFEKDKNTLLKKYQEQLKRTNSYILKSTQKLEELRNSPSPSQLADVIMANLHEFQGGKLEAELMDFYTGEPVSVKLKPNQKPQDHAASLYRKSKNRKLEWEQLEKTIEAKIKQAAELESNLEELNVLDDFRALKNYKKSHGEDKVLQKDAVVLPFKTFEFEGFPIWVGKSAQANDDMLRGYTKKDDIWLHARMVPGSHVLIKTSGLKSIPMTVLETAASLAAFYSKNKNESLAPVIHTEAKYVRKVKGSPAGSVMVEKEKVMMVTPKGPEEIFGKGD
ncbi:putative ribosome quality control (RQC) complex YloA/Tae2 family protein [Algoriphagus sp. 4150]|uniref:NFACT RNA binding domain-containing protein n=1 Tax=Algoriphagus sp. 4150 TaxID=2817756 RepID=UPI0028633BB4|nr:NFACT RNA binding domain-containing protein [Algoriphagus sp. 4150]MDR7130840.1 putative ribosome quality control (RQC) complex YloA/Tae2 family protein [Algoriphagus sp. 4150]